MSEWRMLGPEEVIQKGDEIASRDVNNWFKCCTSIAGTVKDNSFDGAFQFRRRVSPGKEADAPIACCPVCCGMFSPKMLVEKTCAGCWKQRAEKLEDALARNNKTAEHLLQRAERAEDGLDLIYSASGQEHGTPDTVVAGIRHMRLKIDEFIAARQQAEKERDEARRKATALNGVRNQMANAFNASDAKAFWDADDRANSLVEEWTPDLAMALAQRDQLRAEVEEARATAREECRIVCQLRAEKGELEKQRSEWRSDNERLRAENERLMEALEKIASHPFISYERAQGGIYEGQYGIGVVDGHRACSTIAQQALAAKACPHDSVNQGIHPDEGYMVVCKKCGEDLQSREQRARELLVSISRLNRMNFEQLPDGIYFCDGEHEKHVGCLYQKLTADDLAEIFSRFSKQIEEHLKP